MILFTDTHFLLHFKHPQEIPWGEVTGADPILLTVGRTVQKEIEKHKYEQRGRVQDRARDYAAKIAQVAADERPVVLRERKPQVLLDFQATRPAGWQAPADLDPGWGDDMIIADVLAYRHAHPEADVALLTGDGGLIAGAKAHGIPVIRLGDRGWEQPPERSAEGKELEKLRRENDSLKRAGPVIACTTSIAGAQVTEVRLEVVRHPPLNRDQIDALLAEVWARHPRVEDFSPPPDPRPTDVAPGRGVCLDSIAAPSEWQPPTQEEIDAYTRQHDAWFRELAAFLQKTPASLDAPRVHAGLKLVLENNGNVPGEGVRLTIEAVGDFMLTYLDDDAEEAPEPVPLPGRFRAPPTAPRPLRVIKEPLRPPGREIEAGLLAQIRAGDAAVRFGSLAQRASEIDRASRLLGTPQVGGALDHFLNPSHSAYAVAARPPVFPSLLPHITHLPKARDPHAFYWHQTPSRSLVERLELECEAFRHRMDPEVFDLRVTADVDGGPPRNGAIKIRLFARNMREPFGAIVPVRFEHKEVNTFALMRGLLPL